MANAVGNNEGAVPLGMAVLGGSFNPPHRTHVSLARQALQLLPIQELRAIPSGDHPHKRERSDMAPAEHRLAMARIAFAGVPGVVVDDRELHRQGPSFTVDTLAELRAEQPGRRLFFLIGSDNLPLLPTWDRHHRLLELATVVTFPRLGYPVEPHSLADLDLTLEERTSLLANLLQVPADDLSASDIREQLQADGPARPDARPDVRPDALTAEVASYIREHGLYR